MLDALINTTTEGEVLDVRVGLFWTSVVSEIGGERHCGLASTITDNVHAHGTPLVPDAGDLIGCSTDTLAQWVLSDNLALRSIGMAAINSVVNQFSNDYTTANAVEIISQCGNDKKIVIVGHFPFVDDLRQAIRELYVLELNPQEGDLPAEKASEIIPEADVIVLTSSTLINGTFDTLHNLIQEGSLEMLIGPSTPLHKEMFNLGVDILSGCIVENIPKVIQTVSQGGNFRQVHRAGVRLVNLYSSPP